MIHMFVNMPIKESSEYCTMNKKYVSYRLGRSIGFLSSLSVIFSNPVIYWYTARNCWSGKLLNCALFLSIFTILIFDRKFLNLVKLFNYWLSRDQHDAPTVSTSHGIFSLAAPLKKPVNETQNRTSNWMIIQSLASYFY